MEYVVKDLNAQVRAGNIRSTLDAFALVPNVLKKLMDKNGLVVDDHDLDRFVPIHPWMATLKDIGARVGDGTLQSVGRLVIDNARFPPAFDSVQSVLLRLDDIYRLNHHGDVGRYVCRPVAGDGVEVACETPYPRAFERGLIEGIARHARLTGGKHYKVDYEPGAAGSDRTCLVTVLPV